MSILLKILICFLAGAGAGIGTGFAGMSAAAVIGRQVLVGKQQVLGVIGTKPVHHLSCSEKKSPVKMSERRR